jgi:hypothetical protein
VSLGGSEQNLFARWSVAIPDFVKDGVIDEGAYQAASPRILVLLKEVNDPTGGGWDLREFVRAGARSQTWDMVARWVWAIRSLPQFTPWATLDRISPEQRSELLRNIVVMNMKKSPGGHTTIVDDFLQVVQRDAAFIREQFHLYDAEIVIACGSIVSAAFLEFIEPATRLSLTKRGIQYANLAPGSHLFAYSHPAARVAAPILHFPLIDAVREVRCHASAG